MFITFYQFYWYNNMAKSHQYLVYPPRLSITACIRLGILSTSWLMLRWPILRHSSCSVVANSSRFDGWTSRFLTARSRASHACSIGFQSGEYAGHGNWSICCCWRKSCTTRARCGGAIMLKQKISSEALFSIWDKLCLQRLSISVAVDRIL